MARTPSSRSLPLRVLARAVGEVRRTQRALSHAEQGLYAFIEHALDDDARARLTPLLYDVSPHGRGEGVADWEADFFARYLPAAPARLLLPACGAGRVAHVLAAQGYTVDGFDPARSLLALQASRSESTAVRCARASFADMLHDASGDERFAAMMQTHYDAVVFGWTALGHVLSPDDRVALVQVASSRTDGPILFSLPAASGRRAPTRAARLGARAGAGLARRRGRRPSAEADFVPWAGFFARIGDDEVRQWGALTGRRVVIEGDAAMGLRGVLL